MLMKFYVSAAAAALVLALFTGSAEAQNPARAPTFGTATLNAGFVPDPRAVNLRAGGNIQTNLGGVNAWVADAPDYRVNYTAGNFRLTFHVTSGADTTLLINLPNGRWVAVDDVNGLNPQLTFSPPMSGQYDIWVGSFNQGVPEATLYITELK